MCVIHISFNWAYTCINTEYYEKTKRWTFKGYVLHRQKQLWTAARTTYMYIYIDETGSHTLQKPMHTPPLEKERVVSYVKCLDEHINISLKLILIIGCSQISLNKLSLSSRLWFDTWKKCAKTKKYAGPKRQILHSRVHAQIASRTRIQWSIFIMNFVKETTMNLTM